MRQIWDAEKRALLKKVQYIVVLLTLLCWHVMIIILFFGGGEILAQILWECLRDFAQTGRNYYSRAKSWFSLTRHGSIIFQTAGSLCWSLAGESIKQRALKNKTKYRTENTPWRSEQTPKSRLVRFHIFASVSVLLWDDLLLSSIYMILNDFKNLSTFSVCLSRNYFDGRGKNLHWLRALEKLFKQRRSLNQLCQLCFIFSTVHYNFFCLNERDSFQPHRDARSVSQG